MKIEFEIEAVNTFSDGSREIILDIRPEFQVFVGYLLEGLDGYCYHTIIDYQAMREEGNMISSRTTESKKMMKITVTSDFFGEVSGFLNDIQGYDI